MLTKNVKMETQWTTIPAHLSVKIISVVMAT